MLPPPTASRQSTRFSRILDQESLVLRRKRPEVLQLNLGKLCNLTCMHCHVSAGPRRKEIIARETIERIINWYRRFPLSTVDLTGGAPEMAPDFQWLVQEIRKISPQARIIDRCNLVILNEPGYHWLGDFLKEQRVDIVASMPCYSPDNVNAQRGNGVFDRSIEALRELNALGYGTGDPGLPLHLVYNPGGAFLPPEATALEADYKRELKAHFGIVFDSLYVMTNLPIARFASYLRKEGKYEKYLDLLIQSFNPSTIPELMCRNTLSVSWEGEVYDCDFNQMMNLPLTNQGRHKPLLWDLDPNQLIGAQITTADHCFGCTAGAGSSCGGRLTETPSS
ncbi:MAG: arsenosugar biosynthesis radical SAM (seleno)protein ArsS [Puniceicoccaceae bacterium]